MEQRGQGSLSIQLVNRIDKMSLMILHGIATHLMLFSAVLTLLIVLAIGTGVLAFRKIGQKYLEAIKHRFSRVGYARAHVLLGLLFSILFAMWFSEAAEIAFEMTGTKSLDLTIADALHKGATPFVVSFFNGVTQLGGLWATIIIGLGVSIALLARKHWSLLAAWILGMVGGAGLNYVLKLSFQRQRPNFSDPFLVEKFYSFPSGHAMGSVVMYGLLTYLIFVLARPSYRIPATIASLLLGTLIGLSRLVLGVHYFSDVLAGWIVGAEWVLIVVTGTQLFRAWRSKKSGSRGEAGVL